jgi:pilus assembly protein CpaB
MSKRRPIEWNPARRALLLSLGFGALSAVLAGYLLHRYEREVSGGERVLVLRAIKPIERGALLGDDALVTESVPASFVEARAVHAVDMPKVRGVRTASALEPQDTLLWTDLAVSQERRDLSALIQPGSRAVTIHAEVAGASAEGALIRPGDYVDVLANLAPSDGALGDKSNKLTSVLLLQRILVLAVGSITDPQAMRAALAQPNNNTLEGAPLTMSLKVEEAQLLALAQERGKLSVLLRQPDDARIIEAAPELPVSNLFDGAFRNELHRRRGVDPRPVRLTGTAVTP